MPFAARCDLVDQGGSRSSDEDARLIKRWLGMADELLRASEEGKKGGERETPKKPRDSRRDAKDRRGGGGEIGRK